MLLEEIPGPDAYPNDNQQDNQCLEREGREFEEHPEKERSRKQHAKGDEPLGILGQRGEHPGKVTPLRPARKMNCGSGWGTSNWHAVQSQSLRSKPQVLAWLLCDGVHVDPSSGKHTILGMFSNIMAKRFPVVHPHMVWFLALTDVSAGKHTMRISMGMDPTQLKPVIERPFESQGPIAKIYLINEIRNMSFPSAGEYSILIEIDDDPLLSTSIAVVS